MSTETQTQSTTGIGQITTNQWAAGAAGGFVGSVIFGLMMQYIMPPPMLEVVLPAMYGIEGPALMTGWATHQFHGVVLGLAYVALVQLNPFKRAARTLRGALGLCVGYGIVTTPVLAVLVMPLWLSAVGFAGAPPFPNIAIPGTILSLAGHIVFAVPLVIAYTVASE